MFCKWCGNKIENNGVPCPTCGNTQAPLESGNGFWDLCSEKPEIPASLPNATVQDKKNSRHKTAQKRALKKNADQKKSKAFGNPLQIAILCLLFVSIVLACAGIKKVNDYAGRMAMYDLRLSGLTSTVDSGFEEIALYHASMPRPVEEETEAEETGDKSDTTEPEIEQMEPDINTLLDNKDVLLNSSYSLNVVSYSIEGMPGYIIHMASGDLLENENHKVYWQISTDGGVTWETLSEGTTYLVTERVEDAVYRILCLPGFGEEEQKDCFYAMVEPPAEDDTTTEDAIEDATEDATEAAIEDPTEEPTEIATGVTEDDGDGQNIDIDFSGIFD